MSRPQLIYPSHRSNQKHLIADRLEWGIHLKGFNVTKKETAKAMRGLELKKKKGSYQGTRELTNGRTTRISVRFIRGKNPHLLASFYTDANGNDLYRACHGLGEPKELACDGGKNFVTEDEVDFSVQRGGHNRYQFTIKVLPTIIWEDATLSFKEYRSWLIAKIKPNAPNLVVPNLKDLPNAFSFGCVEIANDIPTPKQVIVAGDFGERIEFDPTTDPGYLENLVEFTREQEELDWIKSRGKPYKPVPVAASHLTYKRGTREIRFWLYDRCVAGACYMKYVHGLQQDGLRFELRFYGKKKEESDTIYAVAGQKRFSSVEEIRRIFRKLCHFTHDVTASFLNVEYWSAPAEVQRERLVKLLAPHFPEKQVEKISERLIQNRFKLSVRYFREPEKRKIRELAEQGFLFRKPHGEERNGDYLFNRKLLGN